MATLTGQTIAGTYKDLLKISASSYQAGVDGTLRVVEDGDATASALWLSTGAVALGVDDTGADFRVYSATTNEGLFYDASEDELGLLLTTKLKFHDIGGGEEIYASGDGVLLLNSGTSLTITTPTLDLTSSTKVDFDSPILDMVTQGTTIELKQQVDALAFDGAGDNILNIDASNNRVGIGTATPQGELHVHANPANLILTTTDTAIVDGDDLGNIYFGADDATHSPFTYGALIRAEGAEEWDADHVNHNPTELQFWTSDDSTTAIAQRMVINRDGNVGIGTAAPGTILDVVIDDSTANGVTTVLTLGHSTSGTADDNIGAEILFKNEASDGNMKNTASMQAIMTNADEGDSAYDGAIQFRTINAKSWVDAMHIEHTGKVGIGVTDPETELHIVSSVSEKPVLKLENTTNDADKPGLIFFNNRGAGNAANDDECGIIRFNALDSGNNEQLFASIKAVATNITHGGEESSLYFATGDSAGGLANIVMNQGRLGIGTNAPTHHLHVRSETNAHAGIHLEAQTSGYDAGITFIEATASKWQITSDGGNERFEIYDFSDTSIATHLVAGASDWTNDSDLRIKKDITTLGNSLDAINALRPVSYKRKYGIKDKTHVGLIAQEVKAEIPVGVVHGDESDFEILTPTEDNPRQYKGAMSIQYTAFIPYMIKAIQELSAKVTALESASNDSE